MAKDLSLLLLLIFLSLASTAVYPSNAIPFYSSFQKKYDQGPAKPACCIYTLIIKTSVRSPLRTMDRIGIQFYGRSNKHQAYMGNLNYPRGTMFKRSSTEYMTVYGPCMLGVCSVGLIRHGTNGWIPEKVEIIEPGIPYYSKKFYFGIPLRPDKWQWRKCNRAQAQPDSHFNVSSKYTVD